MAFARMKVTVLATTIAVVGACSGIESSSPVDPVSPGASHASLSTAPKNDTTTTIFVINPNVTNTYIIASSHRLWVRAGGVCSLGSTYGSTTWDDPCVPATQPITVTAKSWYDSQLHPRVDFTPQLRFVPLGGKRASAELYLKDKAGSLDPSSVIFYCYPLVCVNESLTDPSLTTYRDKQQGFVYRRIKHFSGYQVGSGDEDTVSTSGL